MAKKAFFFCVLAMILAVSPAAAKKNLPTVELNVSGGYLDGDTTYEIGGKVNYPNGAEELPFPISRLEFPFDLAVMTGELVYRPWTRWRFSLNGMVNVSDTNEYMKDSDWIYGNYGDPTQKDIYSHSKVDANLYSVDARLRYTLVTAMERNLEMGYTGDEPDVWYTFFAGLGFRYEDYNYDVYDVVQWYPNFPTLPADKVSGPVLKYELQFEIPFAELGCEFWWADDFRLELSTAFSIFVHGSDKDLHLLRDRVSSLSSGWDGKYITGTVRGQYFFCKNWTVDLAITGSRINVDGVSHANDPSIGPFRIDEKVENVQALFSAGLGYRW